MERRAERVPRVRLRRPLQAILAGLGAFAWALGGPAASEAAVPAEFFGMTAVEPTEADFAGMGAAGVGSYRVTVSWRGAQAEAGGSFDWASSDRNFRAVASNGLLPIPMLFGAPAFVTPDPSRIVPPVRNGTDRRAWREFVAAAVARYRPGGEFWVGNPDLDPGLAPEDWLIWNEQNARTFWRPKASPREYARLLRDSRMAIKGQDPDASLVVGGMYGYPRHPRSMSMPKFLKRLYSRRGMKRAIDGVSLHPYAGNLREVKKQLKLGRRTLRRAGDGRAEIWVGEIGWASGGDRRSALVKTKRRQARLLKRSYELLLAKRRRWNIRAAFWFTWRDYSSDSICKWCPKAGLLSRGSKPKPAHRKFTRLARGG
jgi:hypothetical protein